MSGRKDRYQMKYCFRSRKSRVRSHTREHRVTEQRTDLGRDDFVERDEGNRADRPSLDEFALVAVGPRKYHRETHLRHEASERRSDGALDERWT